VRAAASKTSKRTAIRKRKPAVRATGGAARKTARSKATARTTTKRAVQRKTTIVRSKRTARATVAKPAARSARRSAARPAAKVRPQKPQLAVVEERLALTPGNATREECLQRYLPLVRYVVERVASGIPRHVDHEDLVSAGVLGLLNAYDKFDSGKGTKFETYAVWRIRGAVLDQLRSLDWASRSTRRMGREMESCARALDQKLGRTATDPEIAGAMKLKLADYYRLMDKVRGSALVSLDETRHGEEGDTLGLAELLEDPRTPDVLANIEQEETKSFLHATLNRLPEQERLVMALYYYEQMTLREIGEALGISESRVSQIHTRAVERLRGRVGRALAS
jgi:RNA polymerase sigma factor for flagellar operon FliA